MTSYILLYHESSLRDEMNRVIIVLCIISYSGHIIIKS